MGVNVIPNLNHVTAKEEPYSKIIQQESQSLLQDESLKVTGEKEPMNSDAEKQQSIQDDKSAKEIPRNKMTGKNTRFEYNKDIDRIVITISENGTDEVIKEIPPEEVQNMLKRIHTMTGMFMDEEA